MHDEEFLASLISAGNVGLLVAADKYDPAHGTKFLTYAAFWVKEKIREELDNQGVVRVPVHKQKALRAQRKFGDGVELEASHVTLETVETIDRAGPHIESSENDLVTSHGVAEMRRALDALALRERDKYIVLASFGVRDEPKTLKQIASRLDISAEYVRVLKDRILNDLRRYFKARAMTTATDLVSC